MANEKNIKNEINDTSAEVVSNSPAAPTAKSPLKYDPYARIRENENDVVVESEGVETVYSGTGTDLYLHTTPGTDKRTGEARTWFNFRIGYGLEMGKDDDGAPIVLPQMANFDPVARDKGDLTFDVIKLIYAGENSRPVDVVKTSREINGVENTSYSLRLTHKTPSGVKVSYDFRASKASDREVFENYIELLRSYGMLK